jgi:putative YhbY family RNA-binding protein
MPELSPARRRELKARAHVLDPVVLIGGEGLSSSVLAEIDRGLKAHELIKVRTRDTDRPTREVLLEEICRSTGAQPIQHIGKVLVIFRQNPELEEPRPEINARRNVRRRR